VFGPQAATGPVMNQCIDLPSPFAFFQVVELGGGGNGGTNEPPPQPAVSLLESGVAQTNTVTTTAPDHYLFNVSPGAVSAQFEATPVNGDISLVLSYGLPLPGAADFDYRSDRPGATNEVIVLTDISIPVALQPGDWFIGVLNNLPNPVDYTVRASEVLDTNINLIRLTNAVPRNFTVQQGAGLTNFFLFRVPDDHPGEGLRFELFNLTGDAELLVGWDALPSPTANIIREPASRLQPVTVDLRTNTIPELQGNWILSVSNRQPTNLSFTIRASFLGATNPGTSDEIALRSPAVLANGRLQFTWDAEPGTTYAVEFTTNLAPVINWTLLTNIVPTTSTVTFVDPGGVTNGVMRFFRVREQ
jgi:hypothetical protein